MLYKDPAEQFCQNLFALEGCHSKEILKINHLLQSWHEQFCELF